METFVPAGQLYGPILPAFIMNRAISLGAKIAYAFLCDFAGKRIIAGLPKRPWPPAWDAVYRP